MARRIYISRSFDEKDDVVWTTIEKALNNKKLRAGHDYEVIDSSAPEARQLFERISSDINSSDIVLAIMTRRFELEDGKSYAPPPYVLGEIGLGLGRGKQLAMIVEAGIPLKAHGLSAAPGLTYFEFKRSDLLKSAFEEKLLHFLESVIAPKVFQPTHSHRFERYEVHHTVYPNGYGMVHYKIMLEVLKNEPRAHHFCVHPMPGQPQSLPTIKALIAAGKKTPCPYPNTGFLAFGSIDPTVTFHAATPLPNWAEKGRAVRCFEARFPRNGLYKYQYIIGATNCFDPDREIESMRLHMSGMMAPSLSLTLRVHAQVAPRIEPVLLAISGDRYLKRGIGTTRDRDEVLRPYYATGSPAGVEGSEVTPLFRCYHWDGPVAPDHDMLLLF